MRLRALLVVAILAFAASAAVAEAPPMDLPIYPDGEVTMEINMTNEDILPTIKAMLPLIGAKFGDKLEGINAEDLAAIFKDVNRIQVVQVEVAKQGVTSKDVAQYYATNTPKGDWSRVFMQSAGTKGSIALYTQGAGANMALYGFKIDEKVVDGKPTTRALVVKTDGMLDLAKLVTIAAQFFIK